MNYEELRRKFEGSLSQFMQHRLEAEKTIAILKKKSKEFLDKKGGRDRMNPEERKKYDENLAHIAVLEREHAATDALIKVHEELQAYKSGIFTRLFRSRVIDDEMRKIGTYHDQFLAP